MKVALKPMITIPLLSLLVTFQLLYMYDQRKLECHPRG